MPLNYKISHSFQLHPPEGICEVHHVGKYKLTDGAQTLIKTLTPEA